MNAGSWGREQWENMRVEAGYYAVYSSDPRINSACSCVKWRLDPWLIVRSASSKHKLHIFHLSKQLHIGIHTASIIVQQQWHIRNTTWHNIDWIGLLSL